MRLGVESMITILGASISKEARVSAQWLPSRKMCEIKKTMDLRMAKQFSQLLSNLHGTDREFLKASEEREALFSIHNFFQCLAWASSIPHIIPQSSAWKEEEKSIFSTKPNRKSPLKSLKMPPQVALGRRKLSSVLHFTHPQVGGWHNTSMILGARGGWIEILNFLLMEKSLIEELDFFLDRDEIMGTSEMIQAITLFHWVILLSNLWEFLAN